MNATADDHQQRIDLLNQTHQFPTRVTIKVIGENRTTFVDEVVALVRIVVAPALPTREDLVGDPLANLPGDDLTPNLTLEIAAESRDLRAQLDEPPYSIREARGGRHIAITLEPHFSAAEQVLALYAQLRDVQGVVMLL